MEHNEAISWGVATGVWIAVLALLLWLASHERRRGRPLLRWAAPWATAGLVFWVVVAGATRWVERKLNESTARSLRATRPHSGSKSP
jgi:hypothetical protein